MVASERRASDTLRRMVSEVEAEMARAVTYMNDNLVPEVRHSASLGLRTAAKQLGRLAEHLETDSSTRPSSAERPSA